MSHSPNSTTHWACMKIIEKYGGQAMCCGCTNHECLNKPIEDEPDGTGAAW